jgi:plasmid stabilization system protein ParE
VSLAVDIRPRARADIDQLAADFQDARPGAGTRFLAELHAALDRLIIFPGLGPQWRSSDPAHADKRRLVLRQFPVSIFYRASESTITIVRVLHQARDIAPLLEDL